MSPPDCAMGFRVWYCSKCYYINVLNGDGVEVYLEGDCYQPECRRNGIKGTFWQLNWGPNSIPASQPNHEDY